MKLVEDFQIGNVCVCKVCLLMAVCDIRYINSLWPFSSHYVSSMDILKEFVSNCLWLEIRHRC